MSALLGFVIALAVGLLTNELFDASSWLAKRIVRRSAHIRYGDSERADIRAEELAAYVGDRPGNLFKLFTALGFFGAALLNRLQHRLVRSEGVREALDGSPRYRGLDIPSERVARALFPSERYRGEWRKHWYSPLRKVVLATAACVFLTVRPETVLPEAVMEYRWLVGAQEGDAGSGWALSYLHGIWALLPLWTVWCVLSWYADRFSISNKRLIRASGVLSRRYTSVPLSRATDLQFRQSLIGRVLNYGTIKLYNLNWFHRMRRTAFLPNPNEVFLQLSEEIYEPEAVDERVAEIEQAYRNFDAGVESYEYEDPEIPEPPAPAAPIERPPVADGQPAG